MMAVGDLSRTHRITNLKKGTYIIETLYNGKN